MKAFVEALMRAGAEQPFQHDGVIMSEGVPRDVLEAYAAGREARRPAEAILRSALIAWCGSGSMIPDDDPARWPMTWFCLRAWMARCGALEREARASVPRSINEGREARHV